MTFDLSAALPTIVPKAIAWAEEQATFIAEEGRPLSASLFDVAQRVGVAHPERIRVLEVPTLPLPSDPELKDAVLGAGLLGPEMASLTFGYSVYVCRGHGHIRLLSHEFRRVQQYESAGSIAEFLPVYLEQIAAVGYQSAPLEVDARAHEVDHG